MKCLVIGAGNAGRPVARILNYVGNSILTTDRKKMNEFPQKVQETLKIMETEGVELALDFDDFKSLESEEIEYAYVAPTMPLNAPIWKFLEDNNIEVLGNEYISDIINELLEIDTVGITGTLGKTSTTHIVAEIFRAAGYNVWSCSSRMGNLLSEVIVDGIVNGLHKSNDVAVLELPHGTSRLMSKVELKVGIITNIFPDHLDEFDNSMEKYVERKLFITQSSEILVSGIQCKENIESFRDDVIYYCQEHEQCKVHGTLENGLLNINYNIPELGLEGNFNTPFKLMGYYFDNSLGAAAAALAYGIDEKSIKKGLSNFKGIAGHMEYIGNYNGREVHFDAAFVPAGLINTLESFNSQNLIVVVDNPDSTNPRDKVKVGEVIGNYAKVIICSGYNETTKKFDVKAANDVIKGAQKSSANKLATEDMFIAGELAIKHSSPGDIIVHVGPGAITNYDDLKFKMMSGIKEGCKKYD
jgi:UDP-N-acetylmuramoylalanine--D-glutamate ligase